ncbi:GDSL-type esterase/lipase family protein [Actinoplanes regularis]|uniref:GDSL-like Lipase/Acylhydrolase family protein n=1 Tax=Actinoplanes regularis TaxID=52697 RepID=A0A239K3P6_9ACTN|nr:GDSL-type esterase/lipase family protein [Actinoplanes regularis]GIE92336.1 hypothetical protein Are01nite_88160 [Actinoplanes regularis]SNT11784.1 GDSL-like Lipase/Acylhydrolase family protein [Actinoplanes regularis]
MDNRGGLRRTLAFVLALAALLGFVHAEASPPKIWVAFAVFVSVATVWLRGQYADSLDGRQWVIPYRVGAVMIGAAIVLLVLTFKSPWNPNNRGLLGICAIVLIYLVGGSALTQARQTCTVRVLGRVIRLKHCGIRMTFVGLVLGTAGALVLWKGQVVGIRIGALMLGLGVLVLMPIGLALWSEQAIRWLCEKDKATPWLWGLGGAGAAVFILATVAAALASRSQWLIPVLVVLGLFVVALVSTTQADVAAVMAAVALMGVTTPQALERDLPRPDSTSTDVLVALGDSYMSGEGAKVYLQRTDDGVSRREKAAAERAGRSECRRSPTAWPALITQGSTTFDGLKFMACSGDRASGVIHQVQAYHDEHNSFRPSMVVLSLGGNDAGFASIGEMCVAPGECSSQEAMWKGPIGTLQDRLRDAYDKVDNEFKNTPVVVVPYPQPIYMPAKERQCDQVALSWDEQQFVHQFIADLNDRIRRTAQEYGFYYLGGMQEALSVAHQQLCDKNNDGQPGINFIGLRSVHGAADQRFNPAKWMHTSLHPNERGHTAMLRAFQTWLGPHIKGPFNDVVMPVREKHDPKLQEQMTRLAQGSRSVAPPCTVDEPGTRRCKTAAREWVAHQIGRVLLHRGLCLMLAAAAGGAWCMAVALFAYRRRVYAHCG